MLSFPPPKKGREALGKPLDDPSQARYWPHSQECPVCVCKLPQFPFTDTRARKAISGPFPTINPIAMTSELRGLLARLPSPSLTPYGAGALARTAEGEAETLTCSFGDPHRGQGLFITGTTLPQIKTTTSVVTSLARCWEAARAAAPRPLQSSVVRAEGAAASRACSGLGQARAPVPRTSTSCSRLPAVLGAWTPVVRNWIGNFFLHVGAKN